MFPKTVAPINMVLMLHADTPLPAATIARAAGLPYRVAVSSLATLEKRGMVRRSTRAGQDEFSPAKDSPYYPMAYGAALIDLPLADAFHGQRVYLVYAYGSLSRPDGGTKDSDIDLFIVGDIRNREALVGALSEVGARLSRAIDPFILTPEQFDEAKERGDSHVASAIAGIRIIGDD